MVSDSRQSWLLLMQHSFGWWHWLILGHSLRQKLKVFNMWSYKSDPCFVKMNLICWSFSSVINLLIIFRWIRFYHCVWNKSNNEKLSKTQGDSVYNDIEQRKAANAAQSKHCCCTCDRFWFSLSFFFGWTAVSWPVVAEGFWTISLAWKTMNTQYPTNLGVYPRNHTEHLCNQALLTSQQQP